MDFSALKFGVIPNDPSKPRLKFADIFTGVVPEHPVSADYLAGSTGWKMLGNDQYGDCVAVGCANLTKHVTGRLASEDYPDQREVFELYGTQNGGTNQKGLPVRDNGMVIQDCLSWWTKNSWSGRKLVAFASVNFHDYELLKAAIAIFGGVAVGLTVTQANQQQFQAKTTWDYVRGSRELGGHFVLAGGYTGALDRDLITIETWASVTACKPACVQNQWNEVWVPIMPEHLGTKAFQEGVSGIKLAKAFYDLTGRQIEIPDPTPSPVPPVSNVEKWTITGSNISIVKG